MSNWSFQRKLTTGVILICVLNILTTGVSLYASRSLISNMTKVTSGEGRDLADARALQLIGLKNIADVHACLLTGGTEFTPAARAGSERARDLVKRLQTQITDPEGRALLISVMAAELSHEDAFTHALSVAVAREGSAKELYPQTVLARSAQYEQALAALVEHRESARLRNLAPAREEASRSESLLITFCVANIVLMVLLCLVISVGLSRSYGEQTKARTLAESGQRRRGNRSPRSRPSGA